jgi:hypothetical protein
MRGRSRPIGPSRTGPRSSPTRSTPRSSPSDSPSGPSTSSSRKVSAPADPDRPAHLTGEDPHSAAQRTRPLALRASRATAAKGEEPPPRQRGGPWVPVMPLIMGPLPAGGDKVGIDRRRLQGPLPRRARPALPGPRGAAATPRRRPPPTLSLSVRSSSPCASPRPRSDAITAWSLSREARAAYREQPVAHVPFVRRVVGQGAPLAGLVQA